VVDPERLVVTIAEQPIDLTPLEFKLLWALTEHRGRAMSRTDLPAGLGADRGHGDRFGGRPWCAHAPQGR